MLRNRAVALILGLIASPLVIALGLGSLQSKSSLNEPFTGRIEILGATEDDFDALKVGLASREQFDRAGILLNPLLYKLKFTLEESESGNNFISITSKDPVREPYLNFLVEMNWANGRLLQEYTVLLDPPLYDSSRQQPQAVAPAPTMPAEAVDVVEVVDVAPSMPASADMMPSGPYMAGREIGPMVETDTLWSIASLNRPDESVSVQQMMLALLRENPGAFIEGNINLLRRGAILRLPEASSIALVSAGEAFEEVLRQHQLWEQYRDLVGAAPAIQPIGATAPAPSTRADQAAQAYMAGREIGPMVETDTLWSIASLNRPDDSVSVQQMMLALLRENPGAFIEGNINLLRRGAILRLPEASSIALVSAGEAFEEVLRQHQLWEQYRDLVGAAPAIQPIGATAPAPSTRADQAAQAATAARLELIAPEGADGGGAPGSAAGGGSDLLREEIDARSQDNAELGGKLLEAEEIIDLLQRQVNIKDDELAALQARLAELGIEHGDIDVVDVDDATVIEPTADAMQDSSLTDEDMDPMDDEAVPTVDEFADDDDVDVASDEVASDETIEATDEFETGDDDAGVDEVTGYDDTATTPERGFPDSLIPVQIAGLVPGGALTVLAIIAVVILGLFAAIISFLMRSRGADRAEKSPKPTVAAVTAAVTDDDSEDPTTTAVPLDDDESEALTDIEKAGADDSFDPNATVEAAADDAEAPTEIPAVTSAPAEAVEEEDPLEEMNVYLAYERFDQAEELCTRVIGEYPDRHEYKLRRLEVYYSSNDRAAYESAARNLFDAVGEADPLWDSALAMWSEMSPDRALFEEGGDAESEPVQQDAATAFVDITGDADAAQAGEDTVTHAPGGDAALDFDLAATDDDGVLDLTAAADDLVETDSAAAEDEILDLTAADDDGGMLDLTADSDAGGVLDISVDEGSDDVLDLADDDGQVLDLTAGDEGDLDISGGDDVLDLTDGGEIDLLDVTSGGSSEAGTGGGLLDVGDTNNDTDLLDVTKTGDISSFDDGDLLNVTSPGLNVADEMAAGEGLADLDGGDDLQITDIADDMEGAALDFDISETVATAFDDDVEPGASVPADDSDEILDLTGGDASDQNDSDDELLDFDIGELGEAAADVDSEASTMVDDGNLEVDQDSVPTVDPDSALATGDDGGVVEDGLDFDITMDSEDSNSGVDIVENEDGEGRLEITMSSPDEDPIDGEISLQGSDLDEISLDTAGDEDFDFALDGTSEMDSIAADDTLDMGSVDVSGDGELDIGSDSSLDELTEQLDGAIDDAALDDLEIEGLELDSDGGSAGEHLQTVAIDGADGFEIEDEDEDDKTIVMPRSDDVERQSDADEADTKLNLAKAYIEIGDADGARSILDEVAVEGNEMQQAEAQALLSQLSG